MVEEKDDMTTVKVVFNVYPLGSEIYIDNLFVGTSPVVLDLAVGQYEAEAVRTGCISKNWTVEVKKDRPSPVYFFPLKCLREVYKIE